MGISSITESKTKGVCQKKGRFLKKVVLAKEVSGRTVQLDEIREIIVIVSRVAQHRKLFWGFLFCPNRGHYMWCRNFKGVCKLNHVGRKTLYLDQLVVWEWSVVLTTEDLQIIKEVMMGPDFVKLTMSHYIRNSIHEWISSIWLGSLFRGHEA